MILFILAYLGGFITILSPCILPVLPFVFAKADQPFHKSGLPLLGGMAVTFTLVSLLAVAGGSWVAEANQWGRGIALVLLSFFALSLIFPHVLEKMLVPLTRLGIHLSSGSSLKPSVRQSFVLGMATGLLWAPCAGPILGLILTGAAAQGTSNSTVAFLVAYALGAASSLGLALVAGGRFFGKLKKYLKAEGLVKRLIGIAVLLGVVSIAFDLDRTVLTRISRFQTDVWETKLIEIFKKDTVEEGEEQGNTNVQNMDTLPALSGVVQWLNSAPLTPESLQGKVILIDFWTYSCINCLRTLPYVQAWAEKYKDKGLVVIGVHTPEFAFEKNISNVEKAVKELGITYPVAIDNNFAVWKAFQNNYWPAHYFVDRTGHIRNHHFGEGEYEESEHILQELLGEESSSLVHVEARGAQAPSDQNKVKSSETYIGYARAANLVVSPPVQKDMQQTYSGAKTLSLNEWSLLGDWKIGAEDAKLQKANGKIRFRFHARDLHLVLGPSESGEPIHFKITLDGEKPGESHGNDVDSEGFGSVKENRLYQLIRQKEGMERGHELQDRTFEIEFLDPGVQAFAFTFG